MEEQTTADGLTFDQLLANLRAKRADVGPTQEELDAIEAEGLSDAEVDAQFEADLQLRELKAKHRDPNSPMHSATSVGEYWDILERVQREDELANTEGVEFVSLDEVEQDEDDSYMSIEVERAADDVITLPLTRDYWFTAWEACWDCLRDCGVELIVGDEDNVTLTRDQAEMVVPRLHQIASGSQSARFGGEIDWDYDDEVDAELEAWEEAARY